MTAYLLAPKPARAPARVVAFASSAPATLARTQVAVDSPSFTAERREQFIGGVGGARTGTPTTGQLWPRGTP